MEYHQHQDSLDSQDGDGSDSSAAVHNELSSNLAESWRIQRAETELRKCLGKKSAETLLKSYSCAWQKDILIQGRMYITPNWFCFYSSILGWETKTKLKFTDVTSISKQKTALVFPNAILIEAGDRKYGFSSVVYRDKVFHVLATTWRNALLGSPLSEAALTCTINDWKSSDHPNTILSTSFTNRSDYESRHTLATGTQEENDSDQEAIDYTPNGRLSSASEVSTGCNSSESNYIGTNNTESNSTESVTAGTTSSSRSSSSTSHMEDTAVGAPVYHRHKLEWCKHRLSLGIFTLAYSKRCSTTLLINILLIIFIIALLLSTLTMLCRLSHVEPSLQPYLLLQPWCKLC